MQMEALSSNRIGQLPTAKCVSSLRQVDGYSSSLLYDVSVTTKKMVKVHLCLKSTSKSSISNVANEIESSLTQKEPWIQQDFVNLMKHFGNLQLLFEGKRLHSRAIVCDHGRNRFLCNLLIEMYGKCGSQGDAYQIFISMQDPNDFSWNIMIAAYARCRNLEGAKSIFDKMSNRDHFSWNAMLAAYSQCGYVEEARILFHEMPQRDVVSWNTMLSAYAQNRHVNEALHVFQQMKHECIVPTKVTFVTMIDMCASNGNLILGNSIHNELVSYGFEQDVIVGNALISMYGRSGNLKDAELVFHKMNKHNVISWTVMLAAHGQHGSKVLQLLRQMQLEGVMPNKVTYLTALDACSVRADISEGKWIHNCIMHLGLDCDIVLRNALISMYGRCGSADDGWKIFGTMASPNVVSWNAILTAYAQNDSGIMTLWIFSQMHQSDILPSQVTYVTVLESCGCILSISEGKLIHCWIIKDSFQSNIVVTNAIINMYGKCGCIGDALVVFSRMPNHDIVSWNAMLASFSQNGFGNRAFELFIGMVATGFHPDNFTCVILLDVCADIGALAEGKQLHCYIAFKGLELNVLIGNSLISMYGGCGAVKDACRIFDKMHNHDVISWNSLLAACSQNGHCDKALKLFSRMQIRGITPNSITLVILLFACTHAGLLTEGFHFFVSNSQIYNNTLRKDHHHCMVDLLGRTGRLDEAEDLVLNMGFEVVPTSWMIVLNACRVYGDLKRGNRVTEYLSTVDPEYTPSCILLLNTFAAAHESYMDFAEAVE